MLDDGATESETRSETLREAVAHVLERTAMGTEPAWIAIDPAALDTPLIYRLEPRTTLRDVLARLAASIDAALRIGQAGQLEIVRVDRAGPAVIDIDESALIAGSLRVVSIMPAVASVTVEYGIAPDGGGEAPSVTVGSGAFGGDLSERLSVATALAEPAAAQSLAETLAARRVTDRPVMQLSVSDTLGPDALQVGDRVTLSLARVRAVGTLWTIERRRLRAATGLEVLV